MPEESGDVTAEALLAAAQEYDTAVEAGEQPTISVVEDEPKKEVQERSPEKTRNFEVRATRGPLGGPNGQFWASGSKF